MEIECVPAYAYLGPDILDARAPDCARPRTARRHLRGRPARPGGARQAMAHRQALPRRPLCPGYREPGAGAALSARYVRHGGILLSHGPAPRAVGGRAAVAAPGQAGPGPVGGAAAAPAAACDASVSPHHLVGARLALSQLARRDLGDLRRRPVRVARPGRLSGYAVESGHPAAGAPLLPRQRALVLVGRAGAVAGIDAAASWSAPGLRRGRDAADEHAGRPVHAGRLAV